jgi:dihydropyrimidinase
MDLAIRGGTVVTTSGAVQANVGVEAGQIVQVGASVPAATEEIDATGMLVLPGVVDLHTHLSSRGQRKPFDDFTSGTRAAAAGGVTTICDFAWQAEGEDLLPAIERALEDARPSVVDYAFHIVVLDPSQATRSNLGSLAEDGFAGLKLFMSVGFDRRADDYLLLLEEAGNAGMLTAIHAEDETIISHVTRQLHATGRGGLEWYAHSRPALAEEIAVRRAIAFAEVANAPLHLFHLSSRGALEALRDARERRLLVYGETRPIYLYLTDAVYTLPERLGARYVGWPPLREQADVDAIWSALSGGLLSTVGTDHAPHADAVKRDPTRSFDRIPPGMANLETMLPMLHSEGVLKGRISLPRMVEVLATGPARIAGLAPRKGAIAPGADADVVIFDPGLTRTVRASHTHTAADYDVFEGWEVTGWPRITISRGDVIFRDGRVTASPGRGRFQPRSILERPSSRS